MLRRFRSDSQGVTSVVFALVALVVITFAGGAIDFARALSLDNKLQSAADAAALSVLTDSAPDDDLDAFGLKVFMASLSESEKALLTDTPRVQVERREIEGVYTAEFVFEASVLTTLLGVVGFQSIPVGGTAEARIGFKRFVDIHVLLDTSDSMGLGSGVADRDALRVATAREKLARRAELAAAGQNTSGVLYGDGEDGAAYRDYYVTVDGVKTNLVGCEFACHRAGNNHPKSTLQIAREAGVELRIDTAKAGIAIVADLAERAKNDDSFVRMGLNTFGSTYSKMLPITADLSAFRNNLRNESKIMIGANAKTPKQEQDAIRAFYGTWNSCWNDHSNTFFDYVVPQFAADLRDWRGKAASNKTDDLVPQQVVLLVTDGLKSQNCAASTSSASPGEPGKDAVYPFRPYDCSLLKSTGAYVAVIYTEYEAEPLSTYIAHARHAVEAGQNYGYKDDRKKSGIERNLMDCASPGLFAKGSEPEEIREAFETVFENIKTTVHLSQ